MSYSSCIFQVISQCLFFVTSISLPHSPIYGTYLMIFITLMRTSGMRFPSSDFKMKDALKYFQWAHFKKNQAASSYDLS